MWSRSWFQKDSEVLLLLGDKHCEHPEMEQKASQSSLGCPNRTSTFLSKWHIALTVTSLPNEECITCATETVKTMQTESLFVLLVYTKTVGIKTFSYLLWGLIYLNSSCLFSLILKAGHLEFWKRWVTPCIFLASFSPELCEPPCFLPMVLFIVIYSFYTHGVMHSSLAASPAQYLSLFGVTQCSLTWRNLDIFAFVTFLYYISS